MFSTFQTPTHHVISRSIPFSADFFEEKLPLRKQGGIKGLGFSPSNIIHELISYVPGE
jgi:hypothetical protein